MQIKWLATERWDNNFKSMILSLSYRTVAWALAVKLLFGENLIKQNSIVVQAMAWCHQASNLYFCQRWPRYISPYHVTNPQWVKVGHNFSKSLYIDISRVRRPSNTIPLGWRHMNVMWSHITGHLTVCLTVFVDPHHRNIKVRITDPFVRGIHQWPVNSPHKGPVTRKKLPFDDVIMQNGRRDLAKHHDISRVNIYGAVFSTYGSHSRCIYMCIFMQLYHDARPVL